MAPRVTVVMATYNWSTVLPYSIGSALDQRFTDFELLVIGDGCTDDSESVVRSIGDARVRWLNLPRFGHQSGPNNEGIRQARGELVAYLGHDDLWLPHHLEVLVEALDRGADVAHSTLAIIKPDGSSFPWTLPPTSVVHRRSVIDRIGGWGDYRNLRVMPEVDLWERARAAGCSFAFVPRLTGIKFSAGWRKDVYRERPCHEQAAWLTRIRSEPDLEATELVKMAFALSGPPGPMTRMARLLVRPWRWPDAVRRQFPRRKGQLVREMLRFKGVRD